MKSKYPDTQGLIESIFGQPDPDGASAAPSEIYGKKLSEVYFENDSNIIQLSDHLPSSVQMEEGHEASKPIRRNAKRASHRCAKQ